ncbi:MAG: hypothetical protein NT086_17490 [Proteobacteria bacterium]|nr:hypothetical protein [Pseudomonadota bacterium]
MYEELRFFLKSYAKCIGSLYGSTQIDETLANDINIEKSAIWDELGSLYDFGILGNDYAYHPRDGKDELYSEVIDLSLFLRVACSTEMEKLIEPVGGTPPVLAFHTMIMAIARYVLDGGKRPLFTPEEGNFLSITDIALLANMDERSVRNAANPKLAGALKTITKFKRTVVTVADARIWLAERKGFVPTTRRDASDEVHTEETAEIVLPKATVSRLKEEAAKSGLSVSDYLEQRLASI